MDHYRHASKMPSRWRFAHGPIVVCDGDSGPIVVHDGMLAGEGKMLDELEWPSLEARRDQSSLLLFHKIHCGAVSIEKDKYITPAHSSKTTRSSHSAQYYTRHTVMP